MFGRGLKLLILFFFSASLVVGLFGSRCYAAEGVVISFSDSGISFSEEGGFSVNGTTLTIKESGTYTVTGSCSEGNIEIAKGISVTLYMCDFYLKSELTAPVVVKKGSSLLLLVQGDCTLISAENPENENSSDEEIADAFEGAAIKVKSASNLTVSGSGTLNIDASSCKNGIKGGATSGINVNGAHLNVNAANTGIACDGTLTVNAGNIDIVSSGDGMKSDPDADDTESAGAICINGGSIDINAQGDGISAARDLNITNGIINIISMNGYNDTQFSSDTMSCKGLKASAGNLEGIESRLTVSGGTFTINTPDDAIHSDAYADITGGTFTIYTGDDGAHADTTLNIGSEGGLDMDPYIDIKYCYEGLEGGTVNTYSGTMIIVGNDDGINSAGGSSSGTNPMQGGGNSFRPGPGGGGGFTPGGGGNYHINIYGGNIYINVEGDGIDANGNINISGGNVEVWGMRAGGDNSPLDFDGTLTINNANVFAGGTKGVDGYIHNEVSTNSSYIYSTSTYQKGSPIYVKDGNGNVIYSATSPKNVNYLFYIPADKSCSFTNNAVSDCGTGGCNSHIWTSAVTVPATAETTGVMTYTCTVCGTTKTQTIPKITSVANDYGNEDVDTDDEIWPFSDVEKDSTGADLLKQAYDLEVVSGVTKPDENGQVKFKPSNSVTRAQFAIMLYKLAEAEGVLENGIETETIHFSDITEGDTGYEAVEWAAGIGIISGFENGTFKPTQNITRAQIAIMLQRYADIAGYDTSATADLSSFADYDTVRENTEAGLSWIIGDGIMTGVTKDGLTYIYPNRNAGRLQCAILIMRYHNLTNC